GEVIINRVQDVEPILDFNQALRTANKKHPKWGMHVASVPNVVIEQWKKENPNILTEPGALKKKLQDYQYSKLLVADRKYL
ncbi:MAG: hypothetical protein AAF387_21155, partial [Pseudomonadota bacterium]